jgi:hypothetical protein
MARAIYEIKLKERYVPAMNEADAFDTHLNVSNFGVEAKEDVEIKVAVQEEHTMKLFVLAVTMYDTDRFTSKEIEASVSALAHNLGYYANADELADVVMRWVERLDGMTLSEVEEWLIG